MSAGDLSAAVLAGGLSRRMGADKALLTLDGVPLIERAVTTLRQLSSDVFIVGDRPAYRAFGAPVVADMYPSTGPLGGIATALRAARSAYVLVVACDMPWLSLPLLRAMAAVQRDYDVLIPVLPGAQDARGIPEPLHAIYAARCLPIVEQTLSVGMHKASGLLDRVRARELGDAWLRRHDPELRSFVNANTPDEFAAARAYERAPR
jgi:molybdopterin-guanine dinucleotide biosynthesis protein A